MNGNELFIEFGTQKQRKAFQKWLEKGGGFQSYLNYASAKMMQHEQPSCISSNEMGYLKGEHGTMEIETARITALNGLTEAQRGVAQH